MTETVLHVGGASPYDVVVGRDLADRLPALLGPSVQRVAVLYSDRAGRARAAARRRAGRRTTTCWPSGCPTARPPRPPSVADDCWEALGERGFTRSDAVVTFGGGAITDLGGFVAATWLRGRARRPRPDHAARHGRRRGRRQDRHQHRRRQEPGRRLPRARRRALRPRHPRHAAARGPGRRPGRGREVRLHRRPADPRAGRGARPGRR